MTSAKNTGFMGFEIERSLSYDLWKPEIGEKRALKLIEFQDQPGKKDATFRVAYCVDLSTGEQIAFVLGAVLESKMKRAGLDVNSCIGVESLPKVKTKSGELAANWNVFILKEPNSIPEPPTPDTKESESKPETKPKPAKSKK